MLIGAINVVVRCPAADGDDVQVAAGPWIIGDATRRIRYAGRKHYLNQTASATLVDRIRQGAADDHS